MVVALVAGRLYRDILFRAIDPLEVVRLFPEDPEEHRTRKYLVLRIEVSVERSKRAVNTRRKSPKRRVNRILRENYQSSSKCCPSCLLKVLYILYIC